MTLPHKNSGDFPVGSICYEMIIDIYADTKTGQISILYDRDFEQKPERLIFDNTNQEMYFLFPGDISKPYGNNISGVVGEYVAKASEAVFFKIQPGSNEITDGFIIPIDQI